MTNLNWRSPAEKPNVVDAALGLSDGVLAMVACERQKYAFKTLHYSQPDNKWFAYENTWSGVKEMTEVKETDIAYWISVRGLNKFTFKR